MRRRDDRNAAADAELRVFLWRSQRARDLETIEGYKSSCSRGYPPVDPVAGEANLRASFDALDKELSKIGLGHLWWSGKAAVSNDALLNHDYMVSSNSTREGLSVSTDVGSAATSSAGESG